MKQKGLAIAILDFDDVDNPLLSAGQAWATHEVGSRLAKKGHTVTSICSRYPGSKNRVRNGIHYVHIGLGTRFVKLNNLAYFFALPFAVASLRCDIIVECFTAPVSTCLTPLFTRIPVVGLPSMFQAEEFSKKYHIPFHWIERWGSRLYRYFMPYSEHIDTKMKQYNPAIMSKIIPEGVGKEFFRLRPRKHKHILFLGRFDIFQKGIDVLLEAYATAKDSIGYPLVIAGHGPDEEVIKKMITERGLDNRVSIVGPAYGKKKLKLLSEAVYVAFPSRFETFSCFALEALAAGVPLVNFSIGSLSWLSPEVSLSSAPFSVQGYARNLVAATRKPTNAKLRKQSRPFARKFSWDSVASEMDSFFRAVIVEHACVNRPSVITRRSLSLWRKLS